MTYDGREWSVGFAPADRSATDRRQKVRKSGPYGMAGRSEGFGGGAVPDFRRVFVPGVSDFFTVVTADRAPILTDEVARSCLRRAMHRARARWPFQTLALVLLPDHLHAIWTLP